MPLLQTVLAYRDVRDLEKLADKALCDQLHAFGAKLSEQEHEDALAFLVATAWESTLKYDPDRSHSFSQFCYRLCRLRLTDWYRRRFGDTRSGQAKRDFLNTVSLDAPIRKEYDDGSEASTVGAALAARQDDSAGDRDTDCEWLFGNRTGEDDWRQEVVRHRLAARSSERRSRASSRKAAGRSRGAPHSKDAGCVA